jgi:hypothetical protein
MFTAHQIVVILRHELSPAAIAAEGGPVEEVQRRILKNPEYKVRNMTALMGLLQDHNLLPFDKFWLRPIMRLYELDERRDIVSMEHEFAALYEMARYVIDANLAVVPSSSRKGALLFAAKYLSCFYKAKHGLYATFRVEALKKSSEYYEVLIKETHKDRDLCTTLIKGIASANLVVNRWNATSADARASKEMEQYIRKSGYMRWAARQMKIWPLIDKPAFNALGIASRFRRRRFYPMLLEALRKAKSEFEKYPVYNESNTDFADFQAWLKEQKDR